MTTILFITTPGCEDCKLAKALIVQAAVMAHEEVTFKELNYDCDEAVEKALLYGLNSVPSFVIRGKAFNRTEPPIDELIQALRSKTV